MKSFDLRSEVKPDWLPMVADVLKRDVDAYRVAFGIETAGSPGLTAAEVMDLALDEERPAAETDQIAARIEAVGKVLFAVGGVRMQKAVSDYMEDTNDVTYASLLHRLWAELSR